MRPAERLRETSVEEVRETRGATVRALAVGVGLSAVSSFWGLHSLYIIRGSWLNRTHFPMGVFAPYLILVLLTPLVRRFFPRLALSGPELLVALCAGLAGGMVPSFGLSTTWIGMLAIPHYLATPENMWGEYLLPHLPAWMVPSNTGGAMRWLFEGLPAGVSIPWGAWAVPLFWWMALIGALALTSFCLTVMLHRQWSDHERLVYPLAAVAVDMSEGAEGQGVWAGLLHNRLFRAGLVLSLGLMTWNLIPNFIEGFPEIPLGHSGHGIYLTRYFWLHTHINFYSIGFAYLASLDLLLSIWLFHLIYIVEITTFGRLGFNVAGWGGGVLAWQGGGALFCYVALGLWMAREHLRGVVRRAFGLAGGADDSDELLGYRPALFGAVFGFAFSVLWLYRAGMGPVLGVPLVLLLFAGYVGLARVVAQTGLLYVSIPLGAQGLILGTVGAASIPTAGLTAMAFTNAFANDGMGLFMPAFTHIAKLGERVEFRRRWLGWAVGLGLLASLATAVSLTLYWGYTAGAYNFDSFAKTPPKKGYPRSAVFLKMEY